MLRRKSVVGLRCVLVVTIVAGWPRLAPGQQAAGPDTVTVGAVLPTSAEALPTPVTVITAAEIERLHVRRIDHLVRQLVPSGLAPDLGTVTEQTAMSVRGAASFEPLSGALKVYLDGIEIANHTFAAIDPNSIERIEIVRGPQAAAMHGLDAAAGAMYIVTKRGQGSRVRPEVSAQAGIGAVESRYTGSGAVRQEYSGAASGGAPGVTYYVGGGYTDVGDWLPSYSLSSPSVFGGATVARGPATLDLSGRYYAQNYGYPSVDPRLDAFVPGGTGLVRNNDRRSRAETYSARFTFAATSWWRHRVVGGVDRLVIGDQRVFGQPDVAMTYSTAEGTARKTTLGYQTWVTAPVGSTISAALAAGLEHTRLRDERQFEEVTGLVGGPTGGLWTGSSSSTTNTGYFVHGQLGWRNAVFLNGGVRTDRNDFSAGSGDDPWMPLPPVERPDAFTSYRAGAAYVRRFATVSVKARAAYGRTMQLSVPATSPSSAATPDRTWPNPRLLPQRHVGGEAGVDVTFGTRGSVGLTRYVQTVYDVIGRGSPPPPSAGGVPGTKQYRNFGSLRNTGIEAEGHLRVVGLHLRAHYAVGQSRVRTLTPWYYGGQLIGAQAFGTPRRTGGGSLAFAPFQRTSVATAFAYVGERQNYDYVAQYRCAVGTGPCPGSALDDFARTYPAYVKADLSVMQQVTPMLGAFVAIENVTNSGVDEVTNAVPGHGRIATIGAKLRY